MRYTLVGAVTLGFDLARLERGPQVASLLRLALACGPGEVDRLAAAHPGSRARHRRRPDLAAAALERETLASVLPYAGRAVDEAMGGEAVRGGAHTLRRLESGLVGDVAGLDHLLRHDILDWTWLRSGQLAVQDPVAADACDVLSDAAAAHYLHSPTHTDLWAEMVAPLLDAGFTPTEDVEVPGAPGVADTLRSLATGGAPMLARWRAVVDDVRSRTPQWAPAMHRVTWALSLSDRLRVAADVQLAGVVAFRRAGLTATDAAYGAWNALAGVLHAQLAADLLPARDAEVLLRPWRRVHD